MWTTVEQVHDLFVVGFFLFEVHKIQQIRVNGFYTRKQTTIKKRYLSCVGGKGLMFCACVCVCFGFRGAKDMVACGPWQVPLPPSEAQMRHS